MTLKHVLFMSQPAAEEKAGWRDWAVISITGFGPQASLKLGWYDILRLEFDDIVEEEEPYIIFNRDHAREIIDFVGYCHTGTAEGILVHCRAGISRSAAVALWIAEHHRLPFPNRYSEYNKHVYNTLRKEYMQGRGR